MVDLTINMLRVLAAAPNPCRSLGGLILEPRALFSLQVVP